jgi:hypothetical protein
MKKEVKKLVQKEDFYLTIFELLKQGLNPSKICSQLQISKQNINYYIRKLKNEGIIEKKGYGTWEVKTLLPNTLTKNTKSIRGHAFIWVIKLPKEIIGLNEKVEGTILNKGQVRLFIKEHKVWIGKKSIVIYEPHSFYGKSSIEARKYAVIGLLEVLGELENKLGIKLHKKIFKPSREHYGQIKNDLARQYNRKGEKLVIHDDLEGDWLWIDDSEGLEELETKSIVRSKQVQDWWNDNKAHDFKVTPSFLLNSINQVTSNQAMFGKNLETHIEAIKTLSLAVNELKETVKSLKKEQSPIKE